MDSPAQQNLVREFRRIAASRHRAIQARCARLNVLPSVVRVFAPGTAEVIRCWLQDLSLGDLGNVNSRVGYERWYFARLDELHTLVAPLNERNARVHPGLKWGHCHKVLCLFMTDVVVNFRCLGDEAKSRMEPWLFAAIDGVVMKRLSSLGFRLPADAIKRIDTESKFWWFQVTLREAAESASAAPIWFDDNWGLRDDLT